MATFVVIKVVGLIVPLRAPESHLETGDEVFHGEVAIDLGPPYPGAPHLPVPHVEPAPAPA